MRSLIRGRRLVALEEALRVWREDLEAFEGLSDFGGVRGFALDDDVCEDSRRRMLAEMADNPMLLGDGGRWCRVRWVLGDGLRKGRRRRQATGRDGNDLSRVGVAIIKGIVDCNQFPNN